MQNIVERKCYISAVDMGSSNVVVAVAERLNDGSLALRALASKPLKAGDVVAGQIENINQVGEAVIAAFEEAGAAANIRITEAYAGVSGEFVRCARHTDYVFVANPQNGVSEQDVQNLFDRMRNLQAPEKEVIMEHIPQNYMIDDKKEVLHPNGSFGRKLSSTFNFVLCATTPMERIGLAFKRAGVELAEVLPNVLSVGESVLNEDEKEEGVAVVDLGAEVTDVTVYHGGVVRYVASIPIGANVINQDIRAMGVPERYVESLKQKYGSAVAERVPEEKLVRVTGRTARITHDILLRNLATVIESRVMDIVEFVNDELKISGYRDRLGYGIVLTGGSANLTDVDELFREATQMDVRVAIPETGLTEASLAATEDPCYATVVGLLMRAAARCRQGTAYVPLPPKPEEPVKHETEPTEVIVRLEKPTEEPKADPSPEQQPVVEKPSVEPEPVKETPVVPVVEQLDEPEQSQADDEQELDTKPNDEQKDDAEQEASKEEKKPNLITRFWEYFISKDEEL